MNFLENIKKKNQFPILFIGSGITLRYFKNAPTWEALLLRLWKEVYGNEIREEQAFYARCNELRLQSNDMFEIYYFSN